MGSAEVSTKNEKMRAVCVVFGTPTAPDSVQQIVNCEAKPQWAERQILRRG